jgi:amidase
VIVTFLLGCRPVVTPTASPPPWAADDWLAASELVVPAGGDVVQATLSRIDALDRQGPALHSYIAVDPTAHGGSGPLVQITVAVKDNVDVAGFATTAGSLALADHRPDDDAFVVARVREAGAVIVGKANLSEWANARGDRSISGWSLLGGQARNPYALDRSPCGSSSGSAVAVAAGLAQVAIGTETDGSILCPSSMNGIVGAKPTVGLVSRDGVVPIAHSQDTPGPMARNVTDVARLLEVMAAADPSDPASASRPADLDTHYTASLDSGALSGATIGVARELGEFDPRVTALLDAAVADLRRMGATVVDPVEITLPDDLDALEEEVLLHEYVPDMAAYLTTVDPALGLRSMADLVAFNVAHPEELALFGQQFFERAVTHDRDDAHDTPKAADLKRKTGPEGIDAALEAHGLDAIVAPTNGPSWIIDSVNGDVAWTGSTSSVTATAGYPAVTVPMGAISGLPVGITFLGTAWSEGKLLAYAYAYEQGTHHRKPPEYRPSATP